MGVLQDIMYGKLIYDYANYANCQEGGTYLSDLSSRLSSGCSYLIIKLSIDDVCSIVFTEAGHL